MEAVAFRCFCADIEQRGIQVSLELTAQAVLLDGRERLRAALQLGLEQVPTRIVEPEDELEYMAARRPTTPTFRRRDDQVLGDVELAAELREHVTRHLANEGLLFEKSHGYFDGVELARLYGEQAVRNEWRAGNAVRCKILRAAIAGHLVHRGGRTGIGSLTGCLHDLVLLPCRAFSATTTSRGVLLR